MSVEKMTLMNLVGLLSMLDEVLRRCCLTVLFHPEPVMNFVKENQGFTPCDETNPWDSYVENISSTAAQNKIGIRYYDYAKLHMTDQEMREYSVTISNRLQKIHQRKRELDARVSNLSQGIEQLSHVKDLDVNLDELFSFEYIKVRFGRLPRDNYDKLKTYEDNPNLLFVATSIDKNYVWGVYFAPSSYASVIDDIFQSLYYERFRISNEAHGTPAQALEKFAGQLAETETEQARLESELQNLLETETNKILGVYSRFEYLRDSFALRRYAAKYNGSFYLVGWVGSAHVKEFQHAFSDLESVDCVSDEHPEFAALTPPTKLKNNWFFRPFEQLVRMYGVPAYNELDPTPLVAVTYSLLFGLMFGDIGHGLLLFLIGLFLLKYKKMNFGAILTRIGVSSMAFGAVFGSVFGNEELIDNLYIAMGFAGKPINVTESEMSNKILVAAIALGCLIILIAMGANIINGIRQKNVEKFIFSANGIAGFFFYISVCIAAVFLLLLDKNIISPLFIVIGIAVPMILIFLREPLAHLVTKRPPKEKQGVVEFIVQNFFELFEILLSFITNTLSFLRVGAFTMSHAIMMSVVFLLASTAGGSHNIFVLIIGNIFVIGIEGLIVGIQVLRLQFYEIFNRFYSGDGKEYRPAKVEYAAVPDKK